MRRSNLWIPFFACAAIACSSPTTTGPQLVSLDTGSDGAVDAASDVTASEDGSGTLPDGVTSTGDALADGAIDDTATEDSNGDSAADGTGVDSAADSGGGAAGGGGPQTEPSACETDEHCASATGKRCDVAAHLCV